MDQVNPKPRNLAALVRARLEEIEHWLDCGVSRQEISLTLKNESGFNVTDKAFEMALYRARKKRKDVLHNTVGSSNNNVLHNTENDKPDDSVLHNTVNEKPEEPILHNTESSPAIRTMEEISKMQSEIDYNQFKTKKF